MSKLYQSGFVKPRYRSVCPNEITDRLKDLLERMGLMLDESKTRQIDAKKESFNFLGFTIRYDMDINGRNTKYWNIVPAKKSEQKIQDKIKQYLKAHGTSRHREWPQD